MSLALTGGDLMELGLWIFVRGSALALVAAAAARVVRADAAVRRLIWAGATVALLITPLLSYALPATRLTIEIVPTSWWDASVGGTAPGRAIPLDGMGMPSPVAPLPVGHLAAGSPGRIAAGPAHRSAIDATVGDASPASPAVPLAGPAAGSATASDWRTVVFLLWAGGAFLLLTRFGTRLVALGWATRRAAPVRDPRVLGIAADAARRLGLRSSVRLVASADLPAPACWGLWRPVVALPPGCPSWTDERLRAVMMHELTHVRRWDYALHLAGELARALYWPNPVVRWAVARAMAEAEAASDAAVLDAGTHRRAYAEILLTEAREAATRVSATRRPRTSHAIPMVEDGRHLRRRLSGVIAFRPSPRPAIGALLRGGAVAVGVVVLLAAFRLGSDRAARTEEALAATRAVDPTTRVAAVRTLGALEADEAFARLVGLLHDEAPDVRAAAAGALVDAVGRRAVPSLLRALPDDDPRVREAVAFALGRTRDRRAFYPLEELTGSVDASLRLAAIWAIGEIKCEPAVARLSALLRRNADADTRLAAARGLRGAPAAVAAGALRGALADPDARVRTAAAESLDLLT